MVTTVNVKLKDIWWIIVSLNNCDAISVPSQILIHAIWHAHFSLRIRQKTSIPNCSWLWEYAALWLLSWNSCGKWNGCWGHRRGVFSGWLRLRHVCSLTSCLWTKVKSSELNVQAGYICWPWHLHSWWRNLRMKTWKVFDNKKKGVWISHKQKDEFKIISMRPVCLPTMKFLTLDPKAIHSVIRKAKNSDFQQYHHAR